MTFAPCPCCTGYGSPLGSLGRLEHYRCRSCGMTFHQERDDEPEVWADEDHPLRIDAAPETIA